MPEISKKKILKILRTANILLFIIYASTIAISLLKKNAVEKEASILQDNQKEKIRFIEIRSGNESEINFEKKGLLWTVSDNDKNNPTLAIADSNMVNALLENTCKKSKMIKKADNKTSLVPFELTEGQSTRITFRDSKGSVLTDFYLGKNNLHTHNTAFRYADETTVWEKEFNAEKSTDINSWVEHLIYPEFISEKNTGLTRGRISKLRPSENAIPEKIIKKEFQESSKIILRIYSAGENYLVEPEFITGNSFDPEAKEALKILKFNYTVSAYTFERLLVEGKNE